jgi:biopolymer transport protein ExbD
MKIVRKPDEVRRPSTAMGDIAFNLLVFFVILARGQDDSHIQWQPAHVPNLEENRGGRVTVVIDTDGKIYMNGNQKSETELSVAISDELGGAGPGRPRRVLNVDKDVTAPRFEPVIEAISQAGGELIHIVEDERQASREAADEEGK